ncbi:MAG TPA: kelch repeat-containing protein, partial [Kofleriaceae bacterium]|nr:kelch repeat-containing protein [Kofleriaceae bacterium]
MMRRALLCLLAGCGDDSGAQPDAPSTTTEGWTQAGDVPHGAIQETAAVGVHGKIYVLGGFDSDDGIVALVQVFDASAGAWTNDATPLPRALHHINAVTDGDTIFVTGALSGVNFTPVGDTYSFTPGGTWQTRAAMPVGRERGAAVTGIIDGKIYVAGGFRGGRAAALVDVYDPVADTWVARADLPVARDHACGGVLDGKLVVAGGRDGSPSGPVPDVWAYDPATNTWTQRAPMPTGRGG